jgi:hypothetical protein
VFTNTEELPKLLAAGIVSKLNQTAAVVSAKLLYSEEP